MRTPRLIMLKYWYEFAPRQIHSDSRLCGYPRHVDHETRIDPAVASWNAFAAIGGNLSPAPRFERSRTAGEQIEDAIDYCRRMNRFGGIVTSTAFTDRYLPNPRRTDSINSMI